MFEEVREEQLVRVPARRVERKEEKVIELDAPLPIAPQEARELPRRWRIY